MRNSIKVFIFATAMLINCISIAAEESGLTVVPGIDFGFKQSSLIVTDKNTGPVPYTVSPSYTTLITSLALAYGKFYGSFSYDTPLSASNDTYSLNKNNPPEYLDKSYFRQESTLTLGYRLIPALNVFAGYIQSETKIRQANYRYDTVAKKWEPTPRDIFFEMSGYFSGLSANHSFEGKGTLSLSAAYAQLSGSQTTSDGLSAATPMKTQSASGYSTSLSWSGPMSESVFYQIGYRYARYFYYYSDITTEEPVRGLTFGVRKYF